MEKNKLTTIIANIIAVSYVILGWVMMTGNYDELHFLVGWDVYGAILWIVGYVILLVSAITYIPKFCLKLLHDYIKKVIKEEE